MSYFKAKMHEIRFPHPLAGFKGSYLLLLLSWRARQALPIWGDRCHEEMRNSTRLWIRRDPSLPRDSWQPFTDWGTTQGRLSLPTADVLSSIVKQSMAKCSQPATSNCEKHVQSKLTSLWNDYNSGTKCCRHVLMCTCRHCLVSETRGPGPQHMLRNC